jgi:hypothetical protein
MKPGRGAPRGRTIASEGDYGLRTSRSMTLAKSVAYL